MITYFWNSKKTHMHLSFVVLLHIIIRSFIRYRTKIGCSKTKYILLPTTYCTSTFYQYFFRSTNTHFLPPAAGYKSICLLLFINGIPWYTVQGGISHTYLHVLLAQPSMNTYITCMHTYEGTEKTVDRQTGRSSRLLFHWTKSKSQGHSLVQPNHLFLSFHC